MSVPVGSRVGGRSSSEQVCSDDHQMSVVGRKEVGPMALVMTTRGYPPM